jgi:nucleotide-binding universal stress UspA family protein
MTVLSPIESILMQGVTHNPTTFEDILEQQGMEAAKRLNEIADDLARRVPGLHVTPRLLEGLPKEAIIDEAEQWGADLIIVGSNGYGAIKRFLLGSVSLAVVLNAPCSVEIVRQSPNLSYSK